jgi:hypothetical protein
MPPAEPGPARRCAQAVNALHSIPYFTDDLRGELAPFDVTDHSSIYLAGRASPLGPVDATVVTAVFNAFSPELIAKRLPGLWDVVTPGPAIAARQRAAGGALERLLGVDVIRSPAMAEAAEIAAAAASACSLPGRPLYAANAALDHPAEPHIALWHAATMLREHRGDGHVAVLGFFEITGVEALVIDCASDHGMPKEIVMPQRGWTAAEWSAAERRLRARGLVDDAGRLTARGTELRDEIELATGRLDRVPYASLDAAAIDKLARFVHGLVHVAGDAGVFPPPLRGFFAPDSTTWNKL